MLFDIFLAANLLLTLVTVVASKKEQYAFKLKDSHDEVSHFRVAIVGAGAAGASAAYYLSKLDLDDSIDITIFEKNDYVGGRTTVFEFEGEKFELGAGSFVPQNSILRHAVHAFNLSIEEGHEEVESFDTAALAVFNGREIIFELSSFSGWKQALELFWKFGVSPSRALRICNQLAHEFYKLYKEPYFPWTDLTKVVGEVGLNASIHENASKYFSDRHVSNSYQAAIIEGITRGFLATDINRIQALSAAVVLTGTVGARAVEGGNYQIFEKMIDRSGADLKLNTVVDEIHRQDGHWTVNGQVFDYVILASPYQFTEINVKPQIDIPIVDYIDLTVTYAVTTKVMNGKYFGAPESRFSTVFAVDSDHDFEAIYHVAVTKKGNHVYKIFSQDNLSLQETATLLGLDPRDFVFFKSHRWHAFPEMIPVEQFVKPEVTPGLFYTSGMDQFITTMETNALSGKNAAYLVGERIRKKL